MKKILLIVACMILYTNIFGQITLEHTYNIEGGQELIKLAKLSENEYKYYYYECSEADKSLKLFNLDHSEYQTINVAINSGCFAHYVSRLLFDNDNGIEFMVSSNDSIIIFDDDGSILFLQNNIYLLSWCDVTKFVWEPIVVTPNGSKLILYTYDNQCNVYSLPGSLSSIKSLKENNSLSVSSPFPNPCSTEFSISAHQCPEILKMQ